MNDSDVIPIERKMTSNRRAKVFMMRKASAQMLEALENYQIDAMYEIERAAVILAGQQMAPKDYSMEKIRSAFQGNIDTLWLVEQIEKYGRWKDSIDSKTFNITWDVCVYATSARETAQRRFCSTPTVMKYLRSGLDSYAKQNGWI